MGGGWVCKVVFCFEKEEELRRFELSLPLFFPRNAGEAAQSAERLRGIDVGNEWGERVIEERRIK